MKAFFAYNGRLLLYHGWSDSQVSPFATIKYYQSVVSTMGGMSNEARSVRLFMASRMGHCGGGDGPNVFDRVGSLHQWVEKGQAPQSLIASHSKPPAVPHPRVAMYKGGGSIDDAANFTCQLPK
jgi:feruloyl esterase